MRTLHLAKSLGEMLEEACFLTFVPIVIPTLLFLSATAHAQQEPPAVRVPASPISGLPTALGEFTIAPPEIALIPREKAARGGQLWIRTAYNHQLYIVGKVDGEQPDFPRSKNQILSKDHVEVWLAAAPDLDFPEIGWGDQFDDTRLPKGDDSCPEWAKPLPNPAEAEKKCRDWATTQVPYRTYLKRLFVRQWLLTPDYTIESFATPAYEELTKRFSGLGDEIPELLNPRGNVKMYLFPEQSGYSFEIVIPLDALPPFPSLTQANLYLEVDVFKPASSDKKMGAYSTSSPRRAYGKPQTFNALRLDPPLSFSLTPCSLPLVGTDKRAESHPAWFIPAGGPEPRYESDAFILVNDPSGYRYEPAGLSPKARLTHYFWQETGPGEWVCGPQLTYKKGGKSASSPHTISSDGFETKRLPDGELFLKTGPRVWYSEFGSGQCGACPRTDLQIFGLGKDMKIREALRLGDVVDGPNLFSQDFTISPDWSQITEFDLKGNEKDLPGSWFSASWCLMQDSQTSIYVYEKCGENKDTKPPNPPILKELRDYENQ